MAAEDSLGFSNTPTITGVYANGTLTLSGTDTVANYQTALQNVTYTNSSQNPSTATRTVSFQVIDDTAVTSNIATNQITITALDNIPIVTTTGTALGYTENQGAAAIDPD